MYEGFVIIQNTIH